MTELTPLFDIYINGEAIPSELMRNIIEIVVDDSLYLPDMFTLRIDDETLRWIDADILAVGTEVQINAIGASGGTQSGATGLLIKGEITALTPHFDRSGEATLVVRGYDRSHRLHRGKKCRSFLNSTDSQIAEKIARELQLDSQIDATTIVHDYIFQDNQTDLEFLQMRAQRIGYEVYVKGKLLHFVKREEEQEEPPELLWGRDLLDFRPRLTTMQQVDEVVFRGWDPKTKNEIISRVSEGHIAPKVGIATSGGLLAREAFGVPAQKVIVDQPIANIDEANTMAQAICDEISGDFIKAEGVSFGDPRVKAGRIITISGVGTRFSGQYFVTSATHIHSENGYETIFNISGRKADTIAQLVAPENGNKQGWGITIGLVTNNKDPDELGRVKVRFPWLADEEESTWARMAMPMAGKERGFYYLPEINDEVLVAFEHGSINHPYILGALWNGRDHPPRKNSEVVGRDGKVNQRIIRSRSGHEIVLDDTDGRERIIIRDKTGKNEIVIDSDKNDMAINVKGNLTIAADGEISIKSKNDLRIEADGKGDIKTRRLDIDGGPRVDVKGRRINLN